MREIGGYFELELNSGREYHSSAIRLNLGRTAFEYILRAKKVQKVFLPYYTCEVMLEPITRLGINYEFYSINERLEPVFNYALLNEADYFLYTNYFGVKDKLIRQLAKKISNLIIDNSQAFYAKPLSGVDTFYSPRKFFGLPDGGYLYTDVIISSDFKKDNSSHRFEHLIGRIEENAETYYALFRENDQKLKGQSIKNMSNITSRLLLNIDYKKVAKTRITNFEYLHNRLSKSNLINFDYASGDVPMVYPFLREDSELRERLIKNKIYTACYWPTVKKWVTKESIEFIFSTYIVSLPIDQRYNLDDMSTIIKLI